MGYRRDDVLTDPTGAQDMRGYSKAEKGRTRDHRFGAEVELLLEHGWHFFFFFLCESVQSTMISTK